MPQSFSQCPCCGKDLGNLSSLMTHMKAEHSEEEILASETKPVQKEEYATVA